MAYFTGNYFLTQDEMDINAQWIAGYMAPYGWTPNSICGMLGNMQVESTVNPGIWQNLDDGNLNLGYGLVQWTPATIFLDWVENTVWESDSMEGNLERINYELENGLQWIPTTQYPQTFQQFKDSFQTPTVLADMFLKNYERPANPNQPIRGVWAERYFQLLDFDRPPEPNVLTLENYRRFLPLQFTIRNRRR